MNIVARTRSNAMKEMQEKMEKDKEEEKIRIKARSTSQKKGKSIATDKKKPSEKKPTRPARKVTKKRSSVR